MQASTARYTGHAGLPIHVMFVSSITSSTMPLQPVDDLSEPGAWYNQSCKLHKTLTGFKFSEYHILLLSLEPDDRALPNAGS